LSRLLFKAKTLRMKGMRAGRGVSTRGSEW
jgi:hypothetical protein